MPSWIAKRFIMMKLTDEGRACIPVGLTKTWDGLINWKNTTRDITMKMQWKTHDNPCNVSGCESVFEK